MKKIKLLFTLVVISLLLSSCDQGVSFNGEVIDRITQKPIQGVSINIRNWDTTYTDSLGIYKFSKTHYGYFGDIEILLKKDGYKTKHLNLTTQNERKTDEVIKLEKSNGKFANRIDQKYQIIMFYINKYFMSLLNLLTLLFVAFHKNTLYRFNWIIGILFLNLTLYFSITDLHLVNFHLINGPIYLQHYNWHPFSLKIVFPGASILFWILYFAKREWVILETETVEELIKSE
jgi:hypothetical protein